VVAFDRVTGKALHNILVWMDKRTSNVVADLIDRNGGDADVYRNICGLPLNTYFGGVKMKWLIENVASVREAHDNGTLVLGTVDTWLVYVSF